MTSTAELAAADSPAAAETPARLTMPWRLSEGTELLGEYDGWALGEPQHLIRRHDGQVIQVSKLIYLVTAAVDGQRGDDAIAAEVRERSGRDVDADNVRFLVERMVAPLGVLATEGEAGRLLRAQPLLAIRARKAVVPERFHRRVTMGLRPLFRPVIVAAVLVALVASDVWLLVAHRDGAADGAQLLLDQPALLLLVSTLTWVSMAFHEFGHATAARYGGARPGSMGVGFYLIWPALYTNVTDTYRLDRKGRLRTDLGGVYFNALFLVLASTVYLLTGWTPLLVFIGLSHFQTFQQFLPFLRLDGYYVVSDLIGVPNLFGYMRPVLMRVVHPFDPQARELARDRLQHLKPRARAVITAWVCITAPLLLFSIGMLLVLAPRYLGTAWASGQLQWAQLEAAIGDGALVPAANRVVNLVLLVAPIAGVSVLLGLVGRRFVVAMVRSLRERNRLSLGLGAAAATAVALLAGLTWPNAIRSSHEWAQAATQPPRTVVEAVPAPVPPIDCRRGAAPIAAPPDDSPATVVGPPETARPPAALPAPGATAVAPASAPVTAQATAHVAAQAEAPATASPTDCAGGTGRVTWMDEVACTAAAASQG